jgi:hypothetical protein
MAQPQLRLRRGRGPSAGVIVRRVILIPRTSHRRHDRHRTMRTEHLPASRVEVRCAGPVAGHLRIASSHRDHLPPCPALRSGGWNRAAPGSCWRRVPMLAARELPANDLLAVPTPPPPVARHLRADPPGMSTRDSAGLRRDQSLDLVARTHRRNRRDGQHRLFAGVTDQLRVSPDSRDIGVDSLTTQLVINRRLTHRADTLGAGLRGRQHSDVDSLWSGYEIVCTDCGWVPATRNPTDARDQRQGHAPKRAPHKSSLYLVVAARTERIHSSSATSRQWAALPGLTDTG